MPAAVVFDLYGTLLAVEGSRAAVAAAGARDPDGFVLTWRRKQLEYSWLASLAQRYRDFDELTALALEWTCAQAGLALDGAQRRALTEAARLLPAHPDAAPALRALHRRGIPLAVLTNGTAGSAGAALERAGLRALFAEVLSAETVRAYKPDPRVYHLALERFACTPRELVFVSSNGWDAAGAASFGFRVAWCNRTGAPPERLLPAPETTLAGLDELEAFVARLP